MAAVAAIAVVVMLVFIAGAAGSTWITFHFMLTFCAVIRHVLRDTLPLMSTVGCFYCTE